MRTFILRKVKKGFLCSHGSENTRAGAAPRNFSNSVIAETSSEGAESEALSEMFVDLEPLEDALQQLFLEHQDSSEI